MTQSAVSKRLQRIEAEWDIKVVKRTSKGVSFYAQSGTRWPICPLRSLKGWMP